MVSKELSQSLILPDRLASRKALTIFEELKQIPNLPIDQHFGGFLLNEEQEREVGKSADNQLRLLVKSLHQELNPEESALVDFTTAIRHIDANVFVLSAVHQEKLMAQAVCLMGKTIKQTSITRVDSFFYYDNHGQEGVIEARTYNPFNGNNRQEFIYDEPMEQKRLLLPEERQLASGFFLLKHPEAKTLDRQSWNRVNGFEAFNRSSYKDGLEVIREVVYMTENKDSQLSYYLSFENAPDEGILVIKRAQLSEKLDERWLVNVNGFERMDYDHLLVASGEPMWDQELEPVFKMILRDGHLSAIVDGQSWHGEEEYDAMPPLAKVLIFRNPGNTQLLKVGLSHEGNIEEFGFENGLAPLEKSLN
ncbi:MAG TPA: hypothetical protein VJ242_03175 [Patescibacteria group bacterium]|nr:hypothetical protein [Patescibacteria group bacterium]